MPRVFVETWIFARAVVDTELGVVSALEVERLHENVRVGDVCLPVDDVSEDLPAGVAACAREIAEHADLASVPWSISN